MIRQDYKREVPKKDYDEFLTNVLVGALLGILIVMWILIY